MIDIHSHIIYDVDDGSSSIEASISLIKKEIENGVTDIVCTPHYRQNMFETSLEKIKENFLELKNLVKNLDVNLYLGQEIYVKSYNILKEHLQKGKVLTINNTTYLLLEFSYTYEIDISEIVYNLQLNGYKVIIAHIERYEYLGIDKIVEIKNIGALMQINASSLIGKNGLKLKSKCKKYLKNNVVSFVSSDIHESRENYMMKAFNFIKKHYGSEMANSLFIENAKILINKRKENE